MNKMTKGQRNKGTMGQRYKGTKGKGKKSSQKNVCSLVLHFRDMYGLVFTRITAKATL